MSTTGEAGRLVALGNNDSNRDGISLQAVTEAARRLDELSTARVLSLAAGAVHAAQKGGQPLGTITPAAIMLLPSGDVKLAPGASRAGYTAPEKLRGVTLDRRSDVFALGVVLWEALAHEKLFDGATDDAIQKAVLEKTVAAPSAHNANVPAELDAICKKALARDPADRYQSARVMAAEIDAVLDDAGYPESNEQIAKYVSKTLSEGTAQPKPPVLPSVKATPVGTTPPPVDKPTASPPEKPADRPLAKTAILGSQSAAAAPPPASPLRETVALGSNASQPAPGDTAKLGSGALSPTQPEPALQAVEAAAKPLAVTAFLGSNASTPPAAPSILTTTPEPAKPVLPAPFKPPAKVPAAIANAETVATPQLAVATPDQAQLAPPPGMTAPPATPPVPLQSADRELTEEHAPAGEKPADPVAVVSLPSPRDSGTGNRDVLAGWGWGTDAHAAIDDDDYEVPSNRRPLIFAIGGACTVAAIIAIVAFAMGGSKKEDDQAASSPPASKTATPEPAAQPPAPPAPPPTASGAQPEAAQLPGSAGSSDTPAEGSAAPSEPVPAPPPTAAEPPKPEPAVAVEPPKPEPPKPEPPKPEPPKAEPPKPEPPKAVKAEPKVAKVETPKKPDKPVKKAEPPKIAKSTKAQPVDPYAEPAKPKVDAVAAYRSGLQQYARGDNAGALTTFRGSLNANPNYAPTWRGLGLVYEKLGNKGQARTAFKKYLQLAPNAGDADQIRDRLERLGS